jgi:hypothetical protein
MCACACRWGGGSLQGEGVGWVDSMRPAEQTKPYMGAQRAYSARFVLNCSRPGPGGEERRALFDQTFREQLERGNGGGSTTGIRRRKPGGVVTDDEGKMDMQPVSTPDDPNSIHGRLST